MIRTSNWTSQPWLSVPLAESNPNSIGYGLKSAWLMNAIGAPPNLASNNYRGVMTGTTKPLPTGSPYGGALTFNGSTAYIVGVVPAGQLDFMVSTAVFTIAMRFRFATVSADALYVLFGGDASTTNKLVTLFFENRVSQSSPKSVKFLVARGAGGLSTITYTSANNAIVDTGWHHLAVTANVSSAIVYVDGIPLTAVTNTSSGAPSGPLTSLPNIGATITGTFPFNGDIEHMYIWNRVLDNDEILGLCADPYQIFASPVLPQIFGYVPGVGGLYSPATLSLGSGGPFFQTPVNG